MPASQAPQPGVSLGDAIRKSVAEMTNSQRVDTITTPTPAAAPVEPAPTAPGQKPLLPVGSINPETGLPVWEGGLSREAQARMSPEGTSPDMALAADMIILQESGGAAPAPNNTDCAIRPSAGCLDLNTGIFQVTADEYGIDWNRLMSGDPEYGKQAVNQLLTGYGQDDASKWGGPSGMTVWDYGQQNLPGGGMEAIARVYFGGDVTGQYIDEQGRSGATYGQQFMDKLYAQGYDPATAAQPAAAPATAGMQPIPPAMANSTAPATGGVDPITGQPIPPPIQAIPLDQGQAQGLTSAPGYTGQFGSIGSPTGAIRTDVIGFGTGGDWANYNAFDEQFTQYGTQFGVDPAILKGMSIVEGGGAAGTPDNGWGNGIMQVQPEWQSEADRLGLPPVNTPEGQIAMAAAILAGEATLGGPTVPGDWKANFNANFFPGGVETRTGSGITSNEYIHAVETLAGDIHAAEQLAPPGEPPLRDGPLQNTSAPQAVPPALAPPLHDTSQPWNPDMLNQKPTVQGGQPIPPVPGKAPLPTIQGIPTLDEQRAIMEAGPTVEPTNIRVGSDAVAPAANTSFDPEVAFPGSSGKIVSPDGGAWPGSDRKIGQGTLPIDPESGATIDPGTGQPVPGSGTPAPAESRPPRNTGIVNATTMPTPDQMTGIAQGTSVPQGDGLGIYAGPEADESWVTGMSPNGGVNGDYKQFVCDGQSTGFYGEDGCCNGGSCSYQSTEDYFDPRSANKTVHPGYDIALENGTPFYAPIDAVVLGTDANPGGEGCASPGGGVCPGPSCSVNHCSWAYDSGMALGGWEDADGTPIVVNLSHVSADESLVGQQIAAGTPLGVGLDKGHVHVEAHGFCADSGTNVILDPSLVMGGFYNNHSACEGVTRPVAPEPPSTNGTTPGYVGTEAYNNLKAGYQASEAPAATDSQGYSQSQPYAPVSGGVDYQQQPAAVAEPLPPPAAYDTGVATQNTGQVVMDDATGRQYEVMADGSLRLIYDPSW
jgi:hypothetical protein